MQKRCNILLVQISAFPEFNKTAILSCVIQCTYQLNNMHNNFFMQAIQLRGYMFSLNNNSGQMLLQSLPRTTCVSRYRFSWKHTDIHSLSAITSTQRLLHLWRFTNRQTAGSHVNYARQHSWQHTFTMNNLSVCPFCVSHIGIAFKWLCISSTFFITQQVPHSSFLRKNGATEFQW